MQLMSMTLYSLVQTEDAAWSPKSLLPTTGGNIKAMDWTMMICRICCIELASTYWPYGQMVQGTDMDGDPKRAEGVLSRFLCFNFNTVEHGRQSGDEGTGHLWIVLRGDEVPAMVSAFICDEREDQMSRVLERHGVKVI
eukprot:g45471.t1